MKLKILLANGTLSLLAGSETWTATLARQLKKQGHEVTCFAMSIFPGVHSLGIISDGLIKDGIPCLDMISSSGIKPFVVSLEENKDLQFDLIIANHHHVVSHLREQFPTTPIISTIHGPIHTMPGPNGTAIDAPEHPALNAKVNQFVTVSEEMQGILKERYNIEAILIRNFLDTKYFDAKRSITPEKPKMFLINTNYFGAHSPDAEIIRVVTKHYDAKLAGIGGNFVPSNDIMTAIEDADIVIGIGRSVLEGVCAGRLGIVHGHWGTGGVIHPGSIEVIRHFNFSGRNAMNGQLWTPEQLIDEIDKYYNEATIAWGEKYCRSEHNVIYAAEQFVQLGRDLLEKPVSVEASMKKFRRAEDV